MRILQSQAESLTISIWMNVPGLRYIQSPSHNFMSVTQPHYNSPPTLVSNDLSSRDAPFDASFGAPFGVLLLRLGQSRRTPAELI
jgi:hypothetical protein